MKSLIFGLFCLITSLSAHAQIFSGLAEIEKAKKEGFYTYLPSEEKFASPAWKEYLKKVGSVENGRGGAIIVSQARIPSISKDPVALLSLISEEKTRLNFLFPSLLRLIPTFKQATKNTGKRRIGLKFFFKASAWKKMCEAKKRN